MRDKDRVSEPKEKGFVGSVLSLLLTIVGTGLAAVFMSVLIEWLGIAVGWWAADHATQMLHTERAYIEAIDRYPLSTLRPVDVSSWASTGVDNALGWSGMSVTNSAYFVAMVNAVKLVILRATLSCFALPGYLLIALAAFFEGLVARDIRKYTGGHESSYVFHKAKRWIVPTVVLTITIYLMLPFSVPPALVFAPTMLFAGLMIYVATSRFKKFV